MEFPLRARADTRLGAAVVTEVVAELISFQIKNEAGRTANLVFSSLCQFLFTDESELSLVIMQLRGMITHHLLSLYDYPPKKQ